MSAETLGEQLEDFAGRARFADMLLGLLGWSERILALVESPRADGALAPDGAVADLLLGVISAGRTLRATLAHEGAPPSAAAGAPPTPSAAVVDPAAAPPSASGLLR
jgi:hypothetical protein